MAGIFSYAKTLWQDGVTAITAARLNHIEQGISDAADSIKTLGDSVSHICSWGVSVSFDLKRDSIFALVLSANSNEQLTPFFVWRSGDSVSHTNLPDGYSVKREGDTITVSRQYGASFVVYRYDFG